MDPFIYQYTCDSTGLTYVIDKLRDSSNDEKTLKLEIPCPHCGGNHTVVAKKK